MNSETRLEPRLWEAVRASLEARNYTAAILDGMHLLSDVIRGWRIRGLVCMRPAAEAVELDA